MTAEPHDETASPHHHDDEHRTGRRILVGAVVLAIVIIVAGVVLTLRDTSRPVTLDEARERTTTTSAGSGGANGPARPEPGVYRFAGTGTGELSTPPLSQSQGPTMPGTVEWLDRGCWSFRIDYSSNHWQQWTYCPEGEATVEAGGSTWQRWMIGTTAITNLSTFSCAAGSVVRVPDPQPGESWQGRCTGTNESVEGETVSAGPHRYDGDEVLDVDGVAVRTQRYLSERTMSGAQTGTDRSQFWFASDTGLPVRVERSIEVSTDTPIGTSTYREEGEFRLVATDPD
jgi:hypothetical protein